MTVKYAVGTGQGIYNVPETYSDIKTTHKTASGLDFHEFYTDEKRSSTINLAVPGYTSLNFKGKLIANSFDKSLNYTSGFTNSWRSGAYLGSDLNEGILLAENTYHSNQEGKNTFSFVKGSGVGDIAYMPTRINEVSGIISNPLGITIVKTLFTNYLIAGVDKIDFLDASIDLVGGISSNSNPTATNDALLLGPGTNQNIDNKDNIVFVAQYGQSLNNYLESRDFLGGTDILVLPWDSKNASLVFSDNAWNLLLSGKSASYSNLEYIQFADKAVQLNPNGSTQDLQFVNYQLPTNIVPPKSPTTATSTTSNNTIVPGNNNTVVPGNNNTVVPGNNNTVVNGPQVNRTSQDTTNVTTNITNTVVNNTTTVYSPTTVNNTYVDNSINNSNVNSNNTTDSSTNNTTTTNNNVSVNVENVTGNVSIDLSSLVQGSTKGSDSVVGTSSADVIGSGLGTDNLTGGDGPDQFVFNQRDKFGKKGADIITDFDPTEDDLIALSPSALKGLGDIEFVAAESKKQLKSELKSSANIVYYQPRGELYYDQNSRKNGFGKGGLFATLEGSPMLSAEDFALL